MNHLPLPQVKPYVGWMPKFPEKNYVGKCGSVYLLGVLRQMLTESFCLMGFRIDVVWQHQTQISKNGLDQHKTPYRFLVWNPQVPFYVTLAEHLMD